MKNANRLSAFTFTVLLGLLLSGCGAMSAKEMSLTKQDDAVSIMKLDTYINEKSTRTFGKFCYLNMIDESGKPAGGMSSRPKDSEDYIFIRTNPGLISITGVSCNEYKVLYNKPRNYAFSTPITFTAHSGRVNYVGDLSFYFSPKNFVFLSDVISPHFASINADDDQERMIVKFQDRYPEAQQAFLSKYGDLPSGLSFEKSLVNDHPQVIK